MYEIPNIIGNKNKGASESANEFPVFIAVPSLKNEESWQSELKEAIESNNFIIPRTELDYASQDDISNWLNKKLPIQCISSDTRNLLISDILYILHLVSNKNPKPVSRFKMRIFTEKPCRRCGFHLDTVKPGSPIWGGLKIYNGEGVDWIRPSDIISITSFYQWLADRDAIVRNYAAELEQRDVLLSDMDHHLTFIKKGADTFQIASGTTILFKHINSNRLWSDHAPDQAWMHCSPMKGITRLVVNISPDTTQHSFNSPD